MRSCVPTECATAAPCNSQPPRQSAPARQLAALGGCISLDSGSSLVPFALAGLRPIPFPIHPRATAPGAASRRRGCGRVACQARAAGRSAAARLFCVTPPVAFAHVSFAVLRHPLLCPSAFPTPPARSALPALPLLGGSLPLPDLHLCSGALLGRCLTQCMPFPLQPALANPCCFPPVRCFALAPRCCIGFIQCCIGQHRIVLNGM